MYATHFGLSRRLFRANPRGTDVFVGPQAATIMAGLKKAMEADDAVVAVSGPVGVGKTTIVKRALENVGANRIVVTINRIQLGHDEVIELLLAGLGARQMPRSMVHRFALFRRLLQQHAAAGTRVFIVVEDASRIGVDALSELEALTAEDSGASSGASIVLMGTDRLGELLRTPELLRLRQRVRWRQAFRPLSANELKGYLKHSFRVVEADFDDLFEAGCGEALHRLSDGTPRLANNVVEQALNSAADQGIKKLSVEFVERVAAEEIGLTVEHSVTDIRDALRESADEANELEATNAGRLQAPADAVDVEASAVDLPAASTPVDDAGGEARILPPGDEKSEPRGGMEAAVAQRGESNEPEADAGVPDLIQDTQPDLEVLAPASAADDARKELSSLFEDDDDLPTLFSSQRLEAALNGAEMQGSPAPAEQPAADGAEEASAEPESPRAAAAPTMPRPAAESDVPAWERDPTLAELRPDLDALERAMALAQGSSEEDDEAPPAPVAADIPELIPEITLDREIQAKIDEATEALRKTHTPMDFEPAAGEDQSLEASLVPSEKVEPIHKPTPAEAPVRADTDAKKPAGNGKAPVPAHFKDTNELKRVASGLAQAKSLDDVDDKMAETLFGEEFSMAAAEVAASIAESKPANDELKLEDDAPPAPMPQKNGSAKTASPDPAKRPRPNAGPVDPGASERLATVRALNNGSAPAGAPTSTNVTESIVMAAGGSSGKSRKPADLPLSIEEQINTSITQTLKTLKIPPPALAENDDDEPEKRGFFSRFKRS